MKNFMFAIVLLLWSIGANAQVSGSTSTKKYHQPSCRYFNPAKVISDLVGYTPAKCCNKATGVDGLEVQAITCGALTKKGTPCKRRVHSTGDRCPSHNGKATASVN